MPQTWTLHRNETSKPRGPGLMPLWSCSLHGRAVQQGPSTAGLSPGPPRPQEMAWGCAGTWRARPGAGAPGEEKRSPHRRLWASAFCPSSKGIKDIGSKHLHPSAHRAARALRCYAHGPHARAAEQSRSPQAAPRRPGPGARSSANFPSTDLGHQSQSSLTHKEWGKY